MKKTIDWNNLGFSYVKTDYRYLSQWKDGSWDEGSLTTDNTLHIGESSPSLHYGQQCFEGLKAYRAKDGHVQFFRIEDNAKRMQDSCRRLLMPEIPIDVFVDACKAVVKANIDYLPPYGSGGTLYLRPLIIGTGNSIAVKPANEYLFTVFCMPVGSYFKGGMEPVNFMVSDYDRAACKGTGQQKVGGNYAASLLAHDEAVKQGFADCIYLDPKTHTKIEEVGAANFFGITKDQAFVTPISSSILPSITKKSLLYLAENYLKMTVLEEDILLNELDRFIEAGACGTAAVITPIGGIYYDNQLHVFYSENEVGPITKTLYDTLTAIQFGEIEGPPGWIEII